MNSPVTRGPDSGWEEPNPDWSFLPRACGPSLRRLPFAGGASAGWHRNAHLPPLWGRRQRGGYPSWWSSRPLLAASAHRREKRAHQQVERDINILDRFITFWWRTLLSFCILNDHSIDILLAFLIYEVYICCYGNQVHVNRRVTSFNFFTEELVGGRTFATSV